MSFDLECTGSKKQGSPDDADDTALIIKESYGEMAGDEVLLRALVSNRNQEFGRTNFWLDVYRRLHTAHPA